MHARVGCGRDADHAICVSRVPPDEADAILPREGNRTGDNNYDNHGALSRSMQTAAPLRARLSITRNRTSPLAHTRVHGSYDLSLLSFPRRDNDHGATVREVVHTR